MPKTLEYFFDVGSPYSYLATTQVEAVAARAGATLVWRPFLLGAVFKATGNDTPAKVMAKGKYMFEDLQRWASFYEVPWKFTSRFPPNTLRPMRALAGVERSASPRLGAFAKGLFEAVWVHDRDTSTDAVIADVASSVGLDGAAVVAAIDVQETKDALRKTTDEAVARGAFGAPTFFVGEQLFWGNDRLVLVERALGA